jgi:hypothetical protein
MPGNNRMPGNHISGIKLLGLRGYNVWLSPKMMAWNHLLHLTDVFVSL